MFLKDVLTRFEVIQAEKIAEREKQLGSGGASNWEDYVRRVGELNGRKNALSELRALVHDLMKEDDEDD